METKITICLGIFISLIVTSLGGFGNFRKRPKLVEIQPLNPKACSTENITLTCTQLNNDTSKSLMFQVHGNRVSDEETTIIDNKTISYTMTNLNSTQDHNANVLCCLESCDGSAKMTKMLQVYDKPKPVENFRCVVNNYRDSMTCDWDLVVNPSPMRVILDWKYPEFSSWTSCPSHDDEDNPDNKTTCSWKSTSDGDFSTKTLYFKVTMTSDCGESASSNYTIDTSDIVKPLPVDELRATVLNSRCISVSWEPGNRAAYVKHYEIYYISIWDNGTQHVIQINDTEAHKWETKMKEICGLHPYTDYTFTVRAHPEGEGYWSDNATITAKTYSDIPSASPRIIEGAFKMNHKDCETSGRRQVTVYWLPLAEINKNGLIEEILLSYTKSGTLITQKIRLGIKVTHHTLNNLDCSNAYSVTVQAKTTKGTSKQMPTGTIQIPVASYGIICPEFRVEMANTTNDNSRDVYIKCPLVSDDGVLNATVFWCEKESGDCKSAVKWKEFNKSAGVLVLPLTSPENYLYGISMETETGSSGLSKWESCIYTKDVAPSKAPGNLKVGTGTEDKTLSVTWTSLMCESGEPYIHKYILQYCRVDNCVTENKTVEVSAMETIYVIKDLEVDKDYSIQMRGVTKEGMLGPFSDSVIGTPEGWTLGKKVGYSLLGIFGGMLVIVGAVFIISYFYRRTKRKFEPPKIESVLVNLVNEKNTDSNTMTREDNAYTNFRQPMLTRQTSTDSGMGDEPVTPPASDKKLEMNRLDNIPEGYIAFVTEGVERTATTSEPTEAVVYSVNETGNAVHSYNDVDTNMVDTRVEEGIRTRDGIRIVPQRQFSLYNVKADSPVAVANVNLNPVNIANRTVGDYVESTITPVPMTTPTAVADVGLNPVNIAKKAVSDYVKSTITHTTTPVAESAGIDNVAEVNRAFEEETELQDQAISSSGSIPDYVKGIPQEGNSTLGNVEREIKIEDDNDELDKTTAEISPFSRLISFPAEDNNDEDRPNLQTNKTENNNHPTSNDFIESLSKPESDMSVKNKKSIFSQCKTQTSDHISLESMHASLKTNSAEVLPSETLFETPISQQANQPTDCISSSSNQNNLIPKPLDTIRSPMMPLKESICTTNPDKSIDDNTDQTNTSVISKFDNKISALNSVSSKQNLKQTPTPYLSIDQLTAMASNVLPVTDQVSLQNQSQATTNTNNQSYVTTDQLNAMQAKVAPTTDTGFRTDNQIKASPVSVTESPNTTGETAQRPVQNTQPLNSIYKTVKQILTIQPNFAHVNGMMNSNTDYQTNDQIPTPQCNN